MNVHRLRINVGFQRIFSIGQVGQSKSHDFLLETVLEGKIVFKLFYYSE